MKGFTFKNDIFYFCVSLQNILFAKWNYESSLILWNVDLGLKLSELWILSFKLM
jgi:hypothetical protein